VLASVVQGDAVNCNVGNPVNLNDAANYRTVKYDISQFNLEKLTNT